MIDVVFISDIHLNPDQPFIESRFTAFIEWAKKSVKEVYILGDLFHLWIGDDAVVAWDNQIADQIHSLVEQGIKVYYLHGNRDFLLGKRYSKRAGWTVLADPTLIRLGDEQVLVTHGDQYCTKDADHQKFRRLTRNRLFHVIFQCLPLKYRKNLANKLRQRSINDKTKTLEQMDVVAETVISDMEKHQIKTLIHGHTHKPGLSKYPHAGSELRRYVLSDWDDTAQILCYDHTKGFYFIQI